jgi:hypothetical protein
MAESSAVGRTLLGMAAALAIVTALPGAGCSGRTSPVTLACTPGQTQACLGPGACNGAQVCASDGKSFGQCDCGPNGEGGASPGVGASSGGVGASNGSGSASSSGSGRSGGVASSSGTSTRSSGSTSSGSTTSGGSSGGSSSSSSSASSSSGAAACTACTKDSDCMSQCGPVPQSGYFWCCIKSVGQCASQSYACITSGSSSSSGGGSSSSSSGGGLCGGNGQKCCTGMMCPNSPLQMCFNNMCI